MSCSKSRLNTERRFIFRFCSWSTSCCYLLVWLIINEVNQHLDKLWNSSCQNWTKFPDFKCFVSIKKTWTRQWQLHYISYVQKDENLYTLYCFSFFFFLVHIYCWIVLVATLYWFAINKILFTLHRNLLTFNFGCKWAFTDIFKF